MRKIADSKTVDGHGVAKKLLPEGKSGFPSTTMNLVNFAVKKLMNGENKPMLKTPLLLSVNKLVLAA
jgi:hypothetical protein